MLKFIFSVLLKSAIQSEQSIRRPPLFICPISTAIINVETGTRTILHYRGNLPELKAAEFIQQFDLFKLRIYGWIHFEGFFKSYNLSNFFFRSKF